MNAMRSMLWVGAVMLGLCFAPEQTLAQKQPIKMTVGYTAAGAQYINIFAAKELGLFEKHGLDVTLNQVNSSSQTVASLRSNSIDVVAGPAAPVIDAIAKGVTDFTFIGEAMPHTVLEVWVQPQIKTVKDLVG